MSRNLDDMPQQQFAVNVATVLLARDLVTSGLVSNVRILYNWLSN